MVANYGALQTIQTILIQYFPLTTLWYIIIAPFNQIINNDGSCIMHHAKMQCTIKQL